MVFARPNRHRAKYKAPNAGADSLKGASLPNQASTVHSRQHRHENGCPCEGYGPPWVIPSVPGSEKQLIPLGLHRRMLRQFTRLVQQRAAQAEISALGSNTEAAQMLLQDSFSSGAAYRQRLRKLMTQSGHHRVN